MGRRQRGGGQGGPATPELETFELGGSREELIAEFFVVDRGRARDAVGVCFAISAPTLKRSERILDPDEKPFALWTGFDGKGRGQLAPIDNERYPPEVWTIVKAKTFEGRREISATIPAPSGKSRPAKYIKCLQGNELVYPNLKGPMHIQTFKGPGKPGSREIIIKADVRISLEITSLEGDVKREKNFKFWKGKADKAGFLLADVSFFRSPTKVTVIDVKSGEPTEITLRNKERK